MAHGSPGKAQDIFRQHPRQDRSVGGIPGQGNWPQAWRPERLTIRRVKRARAIPCRANGSHIRDSRTIRRLHSMAVPPAYAEVPLFARSEFRICRRLAAMPRGRLQYRYHSDWKRSGSTARPTAWRGWWRRCQKSGATSLSTCRRAAYPRVCACGRDRADRAPPRFARAMNPMPVSTVPAVPPRF